MQKYEVIIYWSDEDQVFWPRVPELPGCAAHGDSPAKALANCRRYEEPGSTLPRNLGGIFPNRRGGVCSLRERSERKGPGGGEPPPGGGTALRRVGCDVGAVRSATPSRPRPGCSASGRRPVRRCSGRRPAWAADSPAWRWPASASSPSATATAASS